MFNINIGSEPNKETFIFSCLSFFGSFALAIIFCCLQLFIKYVCPKQIIEVAEP